MAGGDSSTTDGFRGPAKDDRLYKLFGIKGMMR